MLTLADIQTPQFQQASGFCTDRDEFLELVNLAVNALIRRGDWPGTLIPVRLCVSNGCITFPRYVGEVRKVNACNSSIDMRNVWYQFLEHRYPYGPNGEYASNWMWRGSCGAQMQMLQQYKAPTFNDIYGPDCYIRVYPDAQEDIGKTIQFFGTDNYNQPLRERVNDVWQEGITITVASPYGSSATPVSRIERVVKQETQGNLNVYSYDSTKASGEALYQLATYAPSETNPSYWRYQLQGANTGTGNCTSGNCCQATIIALVKLQHIPVKVSTDLIIIDNAEAMLDTIRSLKSKEAGNYPMAITQLEAAIESLNRDLENSSPDAMFSARSLTFMGGQGRQQMF